MARVVSYYLCFSPLSASPNGICLKLNNSSIKRQVRNKKSNTKPFKLAGQAERWNFSCLRLKARSSRWKCKRMRREGESERKNKRRREKRGSTGARQRWQAVKVAVTL